MGGVALGKAGMQIQVLGAGLAPMPAPQAPAPAQTQVRPPRKQSKCFSHRLLFKPKLKHNCFSLPLQTATIKMPFSAEPSKEARCVQRSVDSVKVELCSIFIYFFIFFSYAQKKHLQNAGTAAETAGFRAPPKLQRPFSLFRGHIASTAALSSLPGNCQFLRRLPERSENPAAFCTTQLCLPCFYVSSRPFQSPFLCTVDDEFERVSSHLLKRTQAMLDKYRYLLFAESKVSFFDKILFLLTLFF